MHYFLWKPKICFKIKRDIGAWTRTVEFYAFVKYFHHLALKHDSFTKCWTYPYFFSIWSFEDKNKLKSPSMWWSFKYDSTVKYMHGVLKTKNNQSVLGIATTWLVLLHDYRPFQNKITGPNYWVLNQIQCIYC